MLFRGNRFYNTYYLMKKYFLALMGLSIFLLRTATAGEGMWLPVLLGQLNEKEMRTMGMRITAEDIYSINQSSLKDAIVLFGGGCTAELISDQGLLLTNHHCGYGNIQRHSSLEHDYLSNGFWAASFKEELPNPGLSVTFLVRMEEVTATILKGILPTMNEKARDAQIRKNGERLVAEAIKGTHYKGTVKPFFNGNQFYMFITETYTDIRLVGAPPSSIGKFGGDTDNWMWPRHTGDFSLFRIYANKENKPAEYSADNVPFKPKKFLNIATNGVKEGDFTFVYGFPGSTQEYLPAAAVDLAVNQRNPIAIGLREQRLNIINRAMESDDLTRIQYAAKAAGIANFWKKMIGESRGIHLNDGIEKKKAFEQEFEEWLRSDQKAQGSYGNLLTSYNEAMETFKPYHRAYTYVTEGALGIEIIRYANGFSTLVKQCKDATVPDSVIGKTADKLKAGLEGYFKNYNPAVDEEVFAALMKMYGEQCDAAYLPSFFAEELPRYGGDYRKWAEAVFSASMFADAAKLNKLLTGFTRKKVKLIEKDPAYRISASTYEFLQSRLAQPVNSFYTLADSLQRIYMKAQMEMQPGRRFYPDANSTLRVSYGKVEGYSPADAIRYHWFTTLDGIMEKEDPAISDYVVDPKLKELWKNKDFGRWSDPDGTMHVAFIASNHTTGGNSGSPVLDADGNLVGINFDRCWEGTMSDLMYDPEVCRNIALDVRYCLFIIEKLAGANRLIEEMSFSR